MLQGPAQCLTQGSHSGMFLEWVTITKDGGTVGSHMEKVEVCPVEGCRSGFLDVVVDSEDEKEEPLPHIH